jgi:hypothetical protein
MQNEFEKWFKKEGQFHTNLFDRGKARKSWIAALKWVQKQSEYIDTKCEFIEKELEKLDVKN